MINKKIKKFLSVALILLMPTGGMICLADNKCQEDEVKVSLFDPDKCDEFNILRYISRKSLDLMCTDTSKLETTKRVFVGAGKVIEWFVKIAPNVVSAASSIAGLFKKHEENSQLREVLSKDICKILQDLSDKNDKSGIIIASRQLMHNGDIYPIKGKDDYSVQRPKA